MKRRTRTTSIKIVVPTTFKDLAKVVHVPAGTLAARYHRIQDKYPRRVVCLDALLVSHKTKSIRENL